MYQLYAIHAFLVTYKFILAVELESKLLFKRYYRDFIYHTLK